MAPQAVIILGAPTHTKIHKAKAVTLTHPHHIPFEKKEYSPPRAESDLVRTTPQTGHK